VTNSRRDFDQMLKDLLNQAHVGFLRLALPEAEWLEALPTDLPSTSYRADLIWKVRYRGEIIIIHIELQTRPDGDMGMRLLEYGVRIYRRFGLKVIAIVLYLTQTEAIPASPFVVALNDGTPLMARSFIPVRLWEIDALAVAQSDDYTLWPLTPLMAGADLAFVQAVAAQIAAAQTLPRGTRVELEGALALFASLRLSAEQIETISRGSPMIEDLLKDSGFYEWVASREVPKAKEEGRKEGQIEGRKEGVITTQQDILLMLAEARFTTLNEATRMQIAAIDDAARLKAAISALATMPDEAALVAFLQAPRNAPPTSA
jgi:predicted transposase YdaD